VRTYIAETYAKAGQYNLAAREYMRAIALDATLQDAFCKLADVYRNDGKLKSAVQHYLKCVELQPTHKEAWKWLGQCYRDLGGKQNGRRAIDAYQHHFKANPTDPENEEIKLQLSETD
jgi:tetratricopeptide (TPR) repeat protein